MKKRKETEDGEESRQKTPRHNNQNKEDRPRPWEPTIPGWLHRGASVGKLLLLLALSAFLVLAFGLQVGSGPGFGEEASANFSLQNDKIAVFSGSSFKEPFPTELGNMLGREVEWFAYQATTTRGALSFCDRFEANKFGIIIVGFGGEDRMDGLSWEETEIPLREMFQRLKETGAVVVYNQICPDSSGFGYFPTSQVCLEEGVILVPNISVGIMGYDPDLRRLVFDPHFDKPGDRIHPNDEAYVVYAERTAKVLVETGLAELTQSHEDLLEDVMVLLSNATAMMEELEQRGMDTEKVGEPYAMAEYLRDNQYYYTAKWELENVVGVMASVIQHWDEVTEMFSEARTQIEAAVQAGMDTRNMEEDYYGAEKAWEEQLSWAGAEWYLDRILNTEIIHEPALLCVASLILLPALLRRR